MPTTPLAALRRRLHDRFFSAVHGGRLIYNQCWEDPRIDRELLGIGEGSRVVVITSAGCNALDYLLDAPAAVHAVDVNHRQNALLELKLALIRRGSFADLFQCFGEGRHPGFESLWPEIAPGLPDFARAFWEREKRAFAGRGLRRSFYFHGAAGDAALLLRGVLFGLKPGLRGLVRRMLDAQGPDEQRRLAAELDEKLWGPVSLWLVRQPWLMALLGVPRPQMELLSGRYPGGLAGFVRDSLRHVMAEVPMRDNYFWRVYATGSYTRECCPDYLKAANLPRLRELAGRVTTHTCTLTKFLNRNPGPYSHFVLLDHQDWLAWHAPQALEEEWQAIFASAAPGAKVLLRSAGPDASFLPRSATARLRFLPELVAPLHPRDRVGTYGSTHLAEVL